MLRVDETRLHQVIQQASARVAGDSRWHTAIDKARRHFETNPYLHWDGRELLVLSDSNNIYVAGRACQCESYRRRNPCWHRAAARLLRRYYERVDVANSS